MKERAAKWWDPRTWLAFAFWELHTIFKGYSGDGMAAWNATGIIIVVEILGVGALTSAWAVYHERRLIDHYIHIVALVELAPKVAAAGGGASAGSDSAKSLRAIQDQLGFAAGL
jgi:hypothetical protein